MRRATISSATANPYAAVLRRYGFALLLVAGGAFMCWAMPQVLGVAPHLPFYVAIVAAGAFGGLGPALVATFASAVCVDILFTPPLWQFSTDPFEIARHLIFIVGGIGISFLAQGLRAAKHNADAAKIEAEHAKALAEDANRAKDRFLAVLSHELRTPLAPVLAHIDLLQTRPQFDADVRHSLEIIARNVELEARLIDDLLDVTRIARGKVELDKHPVALRQILVHAVEVCRPDMETRQLQFSLDMDRAANSIIQADAARLQQVFWNLLKNAIKFTPVAGRIALRCHNDDDHVVVEVSDSGMGIDQEALGRIFAPFEQAERSITRQFGGLGLGLAISKALVEIHGGTIAAHSAGRGTGSTFRVRLPLLAVAAPDLRASSPSSTAASPTRRSLKILLVEDHGDTAQIMRRLLQADGHMVSVAGDVATALKFATEQTFDLLLSDLGLPDGSGLDILRTLRSKGRALPAVALSGYGQETDIQQARDAGFAAHLTKPVKVETLESTIQEVTAHAYAATTT